MIESDGANLAADTAFDAGFRLTADDYHAFRSAYRRATHARRQRRVMLWVALIAFAAATAYNLVVQPDFTMAAVWLLYGALLFAYLTEGGRRIERWQFQRSKLGEQDVSFTADDAGVVMLSPPLIDARLSWDEVVFLDVTDTHAFLWPSDQFAYIVPLGAFQDRVDADRFVALAKEKTAGKTLY